MVIPVLDLRQAVGKLAYMSKRRIDLKPALHVSVAPKILWPHRCQTLMEIARTRKPGGENERTRMVDISPPLTDRNSRIPLSKNAREIESRLDHEPRLFVDVAPLAPDLDWSDPLSEIPGILKKWIASRPDVSMNPYWPRAKTQAWPSL
jgi:hypothetical protein